MWLRLSGDLEGARRLFERALKLDPEHPKARQYAAGEAPPSPEVSLPVPSEAPVPPAEANPFERQAPVSSPSQMMSDWGMATGFSLTPAPAPAPETPVTMAQEPAPDDWGAATGPGGEHPPPPVPTASVVLGDGPGLPAPPPTPPIFGGPPGPRPSSPSGVQPAAPVMASSGSGLGRPPPSMFSSSPSGSSLPISGIPSSPAGALNLSLPQTVRIDGAAAPASPPRATPPMYTDPPVPTARSTPPLFVADVAVPQTVVLSGEAPRASPPRATPPMFEDPAPAPALATPEVAVAHAPDPVQAWAWSSPVPSSSPSRITGVPAPWPDDGPIPSPQPSPSLAPFAQSAWDAKSNPGIKLAAIVGEARALEMLSDDRPAPAALEPLRPVRSEIDTLVRGARDLLDLDDHTGAMELILKAQQQAPDHPEVQALREKSERTLLAMFESKLGRLEATPRVLLKDDEIIWLNLDHRAGFVLAQIDGTVTFDDVFAVSGMSRLDTVRILAQLIDEGVISRG